MLLLVSYSMCKLSNLFIFVSMVFSVKNSANQKNEYNTGSRRS